MKSPGIRFIQRVYKPFIHFLALIPLGLLVSGFIFHSLGVNPVETMTRETGQWGLRLLLITLSVTPLAKLTRSGWLVQFRRLLGLYCFFYILIHFSIYLLLDLSLDLGFLVEDIIDRPYITVGFSGFVLLLLLALTSPISVRRRMGIYWTRFHRLVYAVGVLGIVHFLWITKADDTEPMIYGVIFALLMSYRLLKKKHKPDRRRPFLKESLTKT
jgi:sulfoxide reductase heme-binding subunit YedZ